MTKARTPEWKLKRPSVLHKDDKKTHFINGDKNRSENSLNGEDSQSGLLRKSRNGYVALVFPSFDSINVITAYLASTVDGVSLKAEELLDFLDRRAYQISWLYKKVIWSGVIVSKSLVKGLKFSFDLNEIFVKEMDQHICIMVPFFSYTGETCEWKELENGLRNINKKLKDFGYDADKDVGMKNFLQMIRNNRLEELMKSSLFWEWPNKREYICRVRKIRKQLPRDYETALTDCFKKCWYKVKKDKDLSKFLEFFLDRKKRDPVTFMRFCIMHLSCIMEWIREKEIREQKNECLNIHSEKELMQRFEVVFGPQIYKMIEILKPLHSSQDYDFGSFSNM